MRSITLPAFLLLASTLTFIACSREDFCEACIEQNKPPVAIAGNDTALVLPVNSISLDGSASTDPEGATLLFHWTKIAGPDSSKITDQSSPKTLAKDLTRGVYQFQLMVTDGGGLFAKDTITINVDSVPPTTMLCGLRKAVIGSLSLQREEVDILSAGNKILFAAGHEAILSGGTDDPWARVDIYDTVTQKWSKTELSMARYHIGTIASGNKVYFAGGFTEHPVSRVDIYDASNNTWSTAELSESRSQVVAAAAGNKVLFAGGIKYSMPSNIVDIYDQSTGTWSAVLLSDQTQGSYNMKYSIDRSGVISVGNKVYFMLNNHNVDVYDAQANTWTTLTGYPHPLRDYAAVSLGNSIYFPGMSISGGFSNTLDIYNVNSNTWTTVDMEHLRSYMVAAAADNKIFWAGGADSCCTIRDIEIFDISTGAHSFHQLQPGDYDVNVLKTDTKLIFSYLNVSDIYDITTHTWSTCNTSFSQSIGIGNKAYVVAGDNSHVWKVEL